VKTTPLVIRAIVAFAAGFVFWKLGATL